MQVIEKIPFLAPLTGIIGGLKKFLEGIGLKLDNLKSEVTGNSLEQNTLTENTDHSQSSVNTEENQQNKPRSSKNKAKSTGASYATNKPLSDTVKLLKDLNLEESKAFARKIFGS